MERIKEALANQERYLRHYGRPSEEDHSLNDMNRDLIEAMNGYYGQVGSINGELVWHNTRARKFITLPMISVCPTMMRN